MWRLGALLVAVGALWLLADLGFIPLHVGDWWRLWPLVLVAAGLELIFGHQPRGRRWALIVFVALLGTSLFWLLWPGSQRAPWAREHLNVPMKAGVSAVRLRIETPVAQVALSAAPPSAGRLLDAELERPRSQRIALERRRSGSLLELALKAKGYRLRFHGRVPRWKILLLPRPRYDLALELGLGESLLDLRRLQLSGLRVQAGVGELLLRLPDQGGYTAVIMGGVGGLTVVLPRGLPVELDLQRGIGEVYVAEASTPASRTIAPLRLKVRAGVGKVSVLRAGGDF